MKKQSLKQANDVFKRIFDSAVPASAINVEAILNGCSSGNHKPHPDGICRGCGRHIALISQK